MEQRFLSPGFGLLLYAADGGIKVEAYYYGARLTQAFDRVFEALEIEKHRRAGNSFVISFTGGGGKTSLIRRLAWEGRELGLKVLVLPTTHMALPERFFVPEPSPEVVENALRSWGIAVTGRFEEQKPGVKKISFWDWEVYRQARERADIVLVEADGAKRLPVKVPSQAEPVIPEDTDLILCVYGLKALGQRGEDCCFRLEQAKKMLKEFRGLDEENREWIMGEEYMACLMEQGYLRPLKQLFPRTRILPVLNQADTKELVLAGKRVLKRTGYPEGLITGNLWKEPSFELF